MCKVILEWQLGILCLGEFGGLLESRNGFLEGFSCQPLCARIGLPPFVLN